MEGRLTKIEDIAPLVRFLVSDGQWITGQTIFINVNLLLSLSTLGKLMRRSS